MSDIVVCLITGTVATYMWVCIIRDLAHIRAAQKIEIESMLSIEKYLDEKDKKDEQKI